VKKNVYKMCTKMCINFHTHTLTHTHTRTVAGVVEPQDVTTIGRWVNATHVTVDFSRPLSTGDGTYDLTPLVSVPKFTNV